MDIEVAFADIAAVFHWPLSELNRIPYNELPRWHELALERKIQPVGFIKEDHS